MSRTIKLTLRKQFEKSEYDRQVDLIRGLKYPSNILMTELKQKPDQRQYQYWTKWFENQGYLEHQAQEYDAYRKLKEQEKQQAVQQYEKQGEIQIPTVQDFLIEPEQDFVYQQEDEQDIAFETKKQPQSVKLRQLIPWDQDQIGQGPEEEQWKEHKKLLLQQRITDNARYHKEKKDMDEKRIKRVAAARDEARASLLELRSLAEKQKKDIAELERLTKVQNPINANLHKVRMEKLEKQIKEAHDREFKHVRNVKKKVEFKPYTGEQYKMEQYADIPIKIYQPYQAIQINNELKPVSNTEIWKSIQQQHQNSIRDIQLARYLTGQSKKATTDRKKYVVQNVTLRVRDRQDMTRIRYVMKQFGIKERIMPAITNRQNGQITYKTEFYKKEGLHALNIIKILQHVTNVPIDIYEIKGWGPAILNGNQQYLNYYNADQE